MVERQLRARGISDPKVLAAFRKVPREAFVPPEYQDQAYEDHPLPIGYDQTISQPYIVALMTECLELHPSDRVLEVGTGSGYQTAVLCELAGEVYSMEFIEPLYREAKTRLESLGYRNCTLKLGDGRLGWPEAKSFQKVIVTAGAETIPEVLTEQLVEGGKIIIPVGVGDQDLVLARKEKGTLRTKPMIPVRFVPLQSAFKKN